MVYRNFFLSYNDGRVSSFQGNWSQSSLVDCSEGIFLQIKLLQFAI